MSESDHPSTNDVAETLGLDGDHVRRRRRWPWGVAVAVLAAAVALWPHRSQPAGARYLTQAVRRGDLVVTVSATGTLEPITKVDVGIEVSGTMKTVDVDYNDTVTNGQVLGCLDTTKLEAQTLQSEAVLAAAQAKVKQAEATVREAAAQLQRLRRVHELSGGKMPAQSDLDTAEATLARAEADEASARASVSQAEATVNVNRTDLSKAVIHSPINGVVLDRAVEPGQTVAAAFQAPVLFTLAENLAQMELEVDVDEADVGQVRESQDATFTVDAFPDRVFPARVSQVRYGPQTVDGVVTYKTVLAVDNSSLELRPGMTATAIIVVHRVADTLLVPNAALRFEPASDPAPAARDGRGLLGAILPHPPPESKPAAANHDAGRTPQIWILREGRAAPLAVTKGMSDGAWTEVHGDGLAAGMDVVTDQVTGSR